MGLYLFKTGGYLGGYLYKIVSISRVFIYFWPAYDPDQDQPGLLLIKKLHPIFWNLEQIWWKIGAN